MSLRRGYRCQNHIDNWDTRYRESQKNHLRHIRVEMLTCVNEDFCDVPAITNLKLDYRGLNELRAGADNDKKFIRKQTTYDRV